ncbi:hypothetical protein [Sandarakinorhabdus sp.]
MPTSSLNALFAGAVADLYGLDPELVVRRVFSAAPAPAMGGLIRA